MQRIGGNARIARFARGEIGGSAPHRVSYVSGLYGDGGMRGPYAVAALASSLRPPSSSDDEMLKGEYMRWTALPTSCSASEDLPEETEDRRDAADDSAGESPLVLP